MESFTLQFQQAYKTVLALILVPCILMVAFVAILLRFPYLSETLLIVIISVFLVLMIIAVAWLITKKVVTPATVTVDDKGIVITLHRPSILYFQKYHLHWENVVNISNNADNNSNRHFVQVRCKNPSFTASLNAHRNNEPEIDAFYQCIASYQESFNQLHAQKILSKNFYDAKWATALTWLVYTCIAAIVAVKFIAPDSIEWYRILSFGCFSSVWLGNYYLNKARG